MLDYEKNTIKKNLQENVQNTYQVKQVIREAANKHTRREILNLITEAYSEFTKPSGLSQFPDARRKALASVPSSTVAAAEQAAKEILAQIRTKE